MSRDFSKVYRKVWKSRKFLALPDDDARYCYLYILTNQHVNSAGCYDLPSEYATADLKWSMDRYRKALLSLIQVGLVEFDDAEATVLITNWVEFNAPTNGRHAAGMLAQLDEVSSETLKLARFREFETVIKAKGHDRDKHSGHLVKAYFERYAKAKESLSAPRPETKTKTETQTETKTKTEKSQNLPPREELTDESSGPVAEATPPHHEGAAPPPDAGDIPEFLDRRRKPAGGYVDPRLTTDLMRAAAGGGE